MRVLVATNELQGADRGDYCWTVEGELVMVDVTECDDPQRCGCGRGFPGLASRRATTTAMVVDLPHIDRSDVVSLLHDHVEQGWRDLLEATVDADDGQRPTIDEQIDEIVDEHLDSIEFVCQHFPVGTVIERSGSLVSARAFPAAA